MGARTRWWLIYRGPLDGACRASSARSHGHARHKRGDRGPLTAAVACSRLGFTAAQAIEKRLAPFKSVSTACDIRPKVIHFGPTQPAFVYGHERLSSVFHL